MAEEPLGVFELEENLSDVQKPPVLPPATYQAEVRDVQIGTSQKGNRYFGIQFVIPPNEIPSNMADYYEDGCALYYNRVIVPKSGDRRALYNLKRLLAALGLDTNTSTIDPNEWMGCKANVVVVNSTYQGEDRAEIRSLEVADDVDEEEEDEAPAPRRRAAGRGRK